MYIDFQTFPDHLILADALALREPGGFLALAKPTPSGFGSAAWLR